MNRFAARCRAVLAIWIWLLASIVCWGKQVESVRRHQPGLIDLVQQVPVSELDSALPEVSLVKWLAVEAGANPKIEWGVNDCRNMQGISVDERRMFPACVEVDAYMNDGRSILLVFARESSKQVSRARSRLCFGQLVTSNETIRLHQLSDLPIALIKTHGTVAYPEIAR